MSKPNVVIHIGPMKTGTTALGYYFSAATRAGILPDNLIYPAGDLWFPAAGKIVKHNALFDFIADETNTPRFRKTAVQTPEAVEAKVREVAEFAATRGPKSTVVFISETISGRKNSPDLITMMLKYFGSVTLVLSIRSFAASGMSFLVHRIKDWRIEQHDLDLLAMLRAGGDDFGARYVNRIERWKSLPRTTLKLIPYFEQEPDGYSSVDRFYALITGTTAPRLDDDFGSKRVHPSLPLNSLKRLIAVKRFGHRFPANSPIAKLAQLIFMRILERDRSKSMYSGFGARTAANGDWELTDAERDEIRLAYQPSYAAIRARLGSEATNDEWVRWFAAEGV
jgi:hypothetical protein